MKSNSIRLWQGVLFRSGISCGSLSKLLSQRKPLSGSLMLAGREISGGKFLRSSSSFQPQSRRISEKQLQVMVFNFFPGKKTTSLDFFFKFTLASTYFTIKICDFLSSLLTLCPLVVKQWCPLHFKTVKSGVSVKLDFFACFVVFLLRYLHHFAL